MPESSKTGRRPTISPSISYQTAIKTTRKKANKLKQLAAATTKKRTGKSTRQNERYLNDKRRQ
jgi:hypothetical protein